MCLGNNTDRGVASYMVHLKEVIFQVPSRPTQKINQFISNIKQKKYRTKVRDLPAIPGLLLSMNFALGLIATHIDVLTYSDASFTG